MTFPQKLQIGGRLTSFPGRSWNAIIDGHQAARGTPGPRQTPGRSRVAPAAVGVQVHNDSGSSVPAGGVLSLGDPAVSIDAFDAQIYQRPFFTGSTPATATLDSLFCVLAERLPDGKIATGYVQGITWARVDINTAGDNVCGLADGNRDYLESGTGSTPILYSEKQDDGTKTGEQWALVQLGAAPAALGTMLAQVDDSPNGITEASFASGTLTYGSGNVNPFEDQGDGTADVDTGTNIEVYNSVPTAVEDGKIVQCKKINGLWFVDVDPCEEF